MSSRGGRPVHEPAARSLSDIVLRVSVTLSVLAVAVVLVLLGMNAARDSPGADAMAHIHGLGIDPADGQLIAATHYGVFRIDDDGDLDQVGPVQDYMGFTVVGAQHYLASGHPGADQNAPGNLGLIESTDGGKSWDSLSLRGEADFHTLEFRHGRVYGHYGGVLMVSEDKKTWDEREQLRLDDLAVSPTDPDTLLIGTDKGVSISTDGGRNFRALPNTPPLTLVEWSADGLAVGVDEDGQVHTSTDQGTTWSSRGSVARQPAALAVEGDSVFIATREGSVLESRDAGARFKVRYDRV